MTAIPLQPFRDRRLLTSRQRAINRFGEAGRHILYTLRQWRQRVRGRNELARLDARALADIGINPADRDFLVNKPFWRE